MEMGDIYFKINEKNLFLDYMLEELNNMQFFYVCKDSNNEKYLVLCTDFEDEKYIIVRISLHDLKGMLYGSMDIRSVFLDKKCWIISCIGTTYEEDLIEECERVPLEFLPVQGEKYKLVDKNHLEYAERIKNEYESMLINIDMISFQLNDIREQEWIDNDLLVIATSVDDEYVYEYSDNKEYLLTKKIVIMAA